MLDTSTWDLKRPQLIPSVEKIQAKKKSLPVLKSGRVLPHSTHVVMSSYKDGRVFEIFVDIEYF